MVAGHRKRNSTGTEEGINQTEMETSSPSEPDRDAIVFRESHLSGIMHRHSNASHRRGRQIF